MTNVRESDIAVIGMAARFPGAPTINQFWQNLCEGRESVTWFSDQDLLRAGATSAEIQDPSYVKAGLVLDEMEQFDAGYFGFSPRDAAILDPQHRHFLECTVEALEHAGHSPDHFPGSIGLFAGSGVHAYAALNLLRNRSLLESVGWFLIRHTGNDKDFLATRASYELDLEGPSINVQTACSTSLVAIHLACQHLLNGECDLALAGGVSIELPHRRGYQFKEGEILSPDGHCRPFDRHAAGTLFGSGVGIVVLRRLTEALEQGDHVWAVIRGSAVNNDGSNKVSYLAPSVDGQAKAIAEALAIAEVHPDTVSYVESHGTGTPIGDPIEVAALTQAFQANTARTQYCAIGSVKSNIGHLDTAAGVASFIKTVLALSHQQIPPSVNFAEPNPAIDFSSTPFFVNDRLRAWSAGETPRRAGVSSLGVGGTNAHIVAEEAPPQPRSGPSRPHQLLSLSAQSETALDDLTGDLAEYLADHPDTPLADIAFTLHTGRRSLRYRRVFSCRDSKEAVGLLERPDPGRVFTRKAETHRRSIAFMFAGGGAQHPGMGRELYEAEPVYRTAVDHCVTAGGTLDFDLLALLLADRSDEKAERELQRPSRALPALFASQYAQATLWQSWGVAAEAFIGHSVGEYTAACLAGVMTPEDALAIVGLRGRLFEDLERGGMVSVFLAPDQLRNYLDQDVSIAAVNGPEFTVATGPLDGIEALMARLTTDGVEFQRIHIDVAAHSAMVEPILDQFAAHLATCSFSPPNIPFVSNVTGAWITDEEAIDPAYWVRHLRNTVQFAEGVGRLLEDEMRVLLEVGPGRTLCSLAEHHAARVATHDVLASSPHPQDPADGHSVMLTTHGRLWQAGASVDPSLLYADQRRRRIPLPSYPFEHERFWIDADEETESTPASTGAVQFRQPVWRLDNRPLGIPEGIANSDILALVQDDPFAKQLTSQLDKVARRVAVVMPGTRFERIDANRYTVRPDAEEDFSQLMDELQRAGIVPQYMLHAWAMHPDPSRPNLDTITRDLTESFFSLHALIRVVGQALFDQLRLLVVTSRMHYFPGGGLNDPGKALALGPCTVLPAEFPTLLCRSVDVVVPFANSRLEGHLVRRLLGELFDTGPECIVAYRGRDRFRRSFERVDIVPTEAATPRVRRGGTYLITGGLGDIGLRIAREFADTSDVNLVLLGRRGLPTNDPIRSEAIRALEAQGATLMVVQADVTSLSEMQEALATVKARFGDIDGVVHAAGVLNDEPTLFKTRESASATLAPKVIGTLVLDRVLREEPLDFFVLFSSISAFAGFPGQIDYAAANAFLDAFAHYKRECHGIPTVSINWTAWQDIGMAAAQLGQGSHSVHPGDGRAIDHPMIDLKFDRSANEALCSTAFTAEDHWVLQEHRLRDGPCVMPGAGYVELARAALLAREASPIELRDVMFLRPFVVEGAGSHELQIHLEPVGADTMFRVCSGDGGAIEHANGQIARLEHFRTASVSIADIRARCAGPVREFPSSDHHAQLQFGPRWGALRRVHFGDQEALAELELPDEFHADLAAFRLHPAMLDMATAGAQELIEGFVPENDFYVPIGYGRLEFVGALPSKVFSHIQYRANTDSRHRRDIAVFDVKVVDDTGRELLRIEQFMMKRLDPTSELETADGAAGGAGGADHPMLIRAVELGIPPDVGATALKTIIGGAPLSQVVVSAHDLDRVLRDIHQANPANAGGPEDEEPPDEELVRIEQILANHPAVAAAAARRFDDHGGTEQIVAYLVRDRHQDATISELRRHMKRGTASTAVPRQFVELDELPLRKDGATDRRALPNPFGSAEEPVAPRTEMEQTIAEIWKKLLGISRVGIHDNFFDIGGHSLLAIRAITAIHRATGVKLNQAIMVLQTMEQIGKECERQLTVAAGA